MTNKNLCLIDGSGFIFRAYFAIKRDLTNPAGVPVKAVYGFVTMIQKLMESHSCDYAAVIFDAARKTFRNEIYSEYKAHRPEPPEDLIPQFALVRDAARALNLPAIDKPDYEADDIIATYALQAKKQGINVTIVSSDKDLMQLIQPGITLYDAMKEKELGNDAVMEKFGVTPDKVLDVLSLMGDSSDNVPGVPGIGPKTAAELINQYGDLDTLLAHTSEIKQNKRRETLEQNADKARLSRQLITLHSAVPDLPPLDSLAVREPDGALLLPFLEEHGFKSLVTKAQQKFGMKAPAPAAVKKEAPSTGDASPEPTSWRKQQANAGSVPTHYSTVRDEAALQRWVELAMKKGTVAFDTETTSLNAMQASLVGFSLCVEEGTACYVPLTHVAEVASKDSQGSLFGDDAGKTEKRRVEGQIELQRAIAIIRPLLEDASVLKVGHNMKYDWLVMQRYGVNISPVDDTMLLSYVLHAGEHGNGMDELAGKYLGVTTIKYDDVTGTGKKRLRFDEVNIDQATQYAAEDADITLRLYHLTKQQVMEHHMVALHESIERPLVGVLARMEQAGILVDTDKLQSLSADFAARMEEYEKEIHKQAGHVFNVGSPKQLGEVLFDEMQLEGGKKSTKTGAYSTDSSVLEELAAAGHSIAENVLMWRQLSKLKSTYTDALAREINPETGRVHTSYAQALTSTGRLSSSDPNLQNIPIRTEEGRKIREAFIAKEGCVLLSADYSQIELRLLAHIADIDVLKQAFQNGDDIHAITASQMFGVPVTAVGSDLRRSAKTINFGIIYGISAHGLAVRLGIPRGEAATYIEQYFKQYPGIRDYMETTKEYARQHGYVETLFGRRCHLPGIHDKNGAMRQFSERAAINAPLQGTAADIIKRAMIAADRKLSQYTGISMLLQVHDELVFEVTEGKVDQAQMLVKQAMEQAASLSVPLVVECGHGKQWRDAH